jgi:hypothetical protein
MTRMLRLAVAAAALAALALPGAALAAYTPSLTVTTAGAVSTIKFRAASTDDATAKIVVYAPKGYTVNVAQPAGTQIGSVNAQILALALGGAQVPLSGTITVDDPARYTTNPSSVACAGAAQHDAVWLLNLTAAGQTLAVPVYVDTAKGPETAFASLKLQTCLSSPDATAAQGGNAIRAKAFDVSFSFRGVLTPSAGQLTWLALNVPYPAGSIVPNAAGAVETRSTVRTPAKVTTTGRKLKTGVRVSGVVTAGGQPAAGVKVQLVGGATRTRQRVLGTVTTKSNGTFSFVSRRKGVLFVRATAVAATSSTACSGASPFAPAPCVGATLSGFTAKGVSVRVR